MPFRTWSKTRWTMKRSTTIHLHTLVCCVNEYIHCGVACAAISYPEWVHLTGNNNNNNNNKMSRCSWLLQISLRAAVEIADSIVGLHDFIILLYHISRHHRRCWIFSTGNIKTDVHIHCATTRRRRRFSGSTMVHMRSKRNHANSCISLQMYHVSVPHEYRLLNLGQKPVS